MAVKVLNANSGSKRTEPKSFVFNQVKKVAAKKKETPEK